MRKSDRWVTHDGRGWTADPDTESVLRDRTGIPVSRGASAGVYTPTSPDDEVGVYLHAVDLLGGSDITGSTPELPEIAYQPDVVY